jgi:probable phosphoglycerate mutase
LHLSDSGRAQAQAVADRIAAVPKVDAVYSSPLERTRETAAPIAKAHGLRVRTDKGLLELDIGAWTGWELKRAAKTPEWKAVQQRPSAFRFPDGESFLEMQGRIVDAVERLRSAHPGGTVVAVSHADPIKAAAADAVGTPLDLFQRIVISPCSVTAILYGDGPPMTLTVNSTGDLKSLAPS